MEKKVLKLGMLGAGGQLIIESGLLTFKGIMGKSFKVQIADIDTVTLDSAGFGRGMLKVIGHGTILASVEIPTSWAEKCQQWILDNK